MTTVTTPGKPLSWGVPPLAGQREFADAARAVASLVLSLETDCPELDSVVGRLREAQDRLARVVPAGAKPRVGRHVDGPGRVYVDHCRDIGAFNPMFPTYAFDLVTLERATGTVSFPVCFEGPAGSVNGGFLAVFFDQIVQQHNCDLGLSGGTRDLNVRYRRPTPLLEQLDFEILREVGERDVLSRAALSRGGELLCSVETRAAIFAATEQPPISPRKESR